MRICEYVYNKEVKGYLYMLCAVIGRNQLHTLLRPELLLTSTLLRREVKRLLNQSMAILASTV